MGEFIFKKMKQNALNRQIGGTHYKDCTYQPIQFMVDMKFNHFQCCVLKYVMRYRKKNGREDLEKALHYCELAQLLRPDKTAVWNDYLASRFVLERDMPRPLMHFLYDLTKHNWGKVKEFIENRIKEEYEA